MIDYQELKRLAEAVVGDDTNWQPSPAAWAYHEALRNPNVVLALIADVERLQFEPAKHCQRLVQSLRKDLIDYQQGAKAEADAGDKARAEVRKLKAEVEALHSFIRNICTSTLDMHIAHSYSAFLKDHEQ